MFKYILIAAVCFILVNPTEAWSLRRSLRKLGRKIKSGVKKIGKGLKKVGCRLMFGVGCPLAVGAAGKVLGATGVGSPQIIAAGKAIAKQRCRVRRNKCKREADMMLLPFSDDIRDYDSNGDKQVSYEEFVFAIMRTVDLADPSELQEPFLFADENADGVLDTDEFNGAPFLFAHAKFHNYMQHDIAAAESQTNGASLATSTSAADMTSTSGSDVTEHLSSSTTDSSRNVPTPLSENSTPTVTGTSNKIHTSTDGALEPTTSATDKMAPTDAAMLTFQDLNSLDILALSEQPEYNISIAA